MPRNPNPDPTPGHPQLGDGIRATAARINLAARHLEHLTADPYYKPKLLTTGPTRRDLDDAVARLAALLKGAPPP